MILLSVYNNIIADNAQQLLLFDKYIVHRISIFLYIYFSLTVFFIFFKIRTLKCKCGGGNSVPSSTRCQAIADGKTWRVMRALLETGHTLRIPLSECALTTSHSGLQWMLQVREIHTLLLLILLIRNKQSFINPFSHLIDDFFVF